jgi:regulator of protease activity HflC (stomatin/prohibitin superfamily)
LNRQSKTYAREGIEIDVSTLADRVGACVVALGPIIEAIRTHVMSAERIHADDTTVPVLAKLKTVTGRIWTYALAVVLVLVAVLIPQAMKVADQWERAVVLRLGKLSAIRGPGLFMIVPFIDEVASWLDQRIQTTEINAEKALSKDTVPVNIDAIIFWQIHDPQRAALEITNYRQAITQVAQTSLREIVGSSLLSTLLSERKQGDQLLREEIGRKTAEWGVAVLSVEIRDIGVPPALQDAMSRQAQAEREKLARVLLGQAEQEIAQKFVEAADIYARGPAALQLR